MNFNLFLSKLYNFAGKKKLKNRTKDNWYIVYGLVLIVKRINLEYQHNTFNI